jgi:hypothetical protein
MIRISLEQARINLVGAVIRRALLDCWGHENKLYIDDAGEFLLTNRLNKFLETFHCQGIINESYIRRVAKGKPGYYFMDVSHHNDNR